MWKVGLLISKETVGEETITYTWDKLATPVSGSSYIVCQNIDSGIWVPALTQKVIARDGKNYITTYANYDNYGNPGLITETGDSTRTTSSTYWYDTTRNIVKDKPAIMTVSGSFSGSFTTNYNYFTTGTKVGLVQKVTRYGVPTTYDYYANGNLMSATDANSRTTSYLWDKGRISKITNPIYYLTRSINTMGTIASETNGRSYTTNYTYDDNLRLTSITPPTGNATSFTYPTDNSNVKESRGGYYIYYYYDGIGRLKGTQDSKNITTSIAYKSCGIKDYSNSNIGDKVSYDNFGREKTVTHQDSTTINYSYSGSDVTVTDEASKATYLYYDAFGDPDEKLLTSVKDANANTTSYTYNILGSLTGIAQGSVSRSFVFDTRNFLISETHPEKGTMSYGRDNVGNMTSKTDGLGTTTYVYDNINRLTSITYDLGTINYGYDNADNRTSISSPSASMSYVYDAVNRLTQKNETILGKSYTTSYSYDANDNMTDIYYPAGRRVTYGYDSNNQVTSLAGFGGSITNIGYCTTGSCIGLPASLTYSNGLATNIGYNNRNLTTQIKVGTSALDMRYGYGDNKGNMTSITDYYDSSKNQTLGYDNLNRLTTFNASGLWGTGSFSYDSLGNRQGKTVAGVVTSYAYSNNRLASTSGGENFSFGYNNSGDVTTFNGYALSYDRLHNLLNYKNGGTTMADYAYDGDGMRVKKTVSSETTVYHYDQGGNVISETDSSGNLIADYIYLHKKLAAKVMAVPVISVTPSYYDFGNISVGTTSAVQTFIVGNTGSANLAISTITLTGVNATEFNKITDTCSGQIIIPSGMCAVQVNLSPAAVSTKSASLSIPSNDPDKPLSTVVLSGAGTVTLTVTKTGTGTGTVTSNPAGINCGTDCTEQYSLSTAVILTAMPDISSGFTGWSGGCTGSGTCIVTTSTDTSVTATFDVKTYTITASANAKGTISPSGTITVTHGGSQTFTITPDTGYHVADVLVDGVSVGTARIYTFDNVTDNHTLSATFAINTYTLTASASANGTISPSGTITVTHGGSQTFTITPDTGYYVADILIDGVSVGAARIYTLTNIMANHTISASFATRTYTATEDWVARYDGPGQGWDFATAIAIDPLGNVLVTGSSVGIGTSNDYATIKYDTNGNKLWVARYNNGQANRIDIPVAMAVDALGNVYVTGFSEGFEPSYPYPLYEFATIKYDANGNQLWVARYHGPTVIGHDGASDLAIDTLGNVYVTGGSVNDAGYSDYATIKYDTDGNQLWVARYNKCPWNCDYYASAIVADALGNIYVAGGAIIKYDTNGSQLWELSFNGGVSGMAVDALGNVYVTGSSARDYITIKYDTNGTQLWVAQYDGPGVQWDDDGASGIAIDPLGNVYVTGSSVGLGTSYDFATIKYDANGNQLWVDRYDGPQSSEDKAAGNIAIDTLGNIYVIGHHAISGCYVYATVKYDPYGNRQWVASYQLGARNHPSSIAVDGLNNVYVTGLSSGDYATIKYSQKSIELNISINPSSLNFGSVVILNSFSQTATVSNIGIADLLISDVTITGTNASDFSQTNNCSMVDSNVTCTINIIFTPALTGTKSATLNILSNDPSTPVLTVSLSGESIATIESLIVLIQQFLASGTMINAGVADRSTSTVRAESSTSGAIDNSGIANSLIAKLINKNLQDFIREVQAQSGKHIAPYAAVVLIDAANYIISH